MSDSKHQKTIQNWKALLQSQQSALKADYLEERKPHLLLKRLTKFVDTLLKDIWHHHEMGSSISLIAVGGYGRQALFPHSDIDLLILVSGEPSDGQNKKIEKLIGSFWDIGFNVGHSVRNLSECVKEASEDITVLTNMLEARLITGNRVHYNAFTVAIQETIDAKAFLAAKLQEQLSRHAKFNDTAYNLEPNVKESPGGLRDLHMILWIARSQNLGNNWAELAKNGVITPNERRQIFKYERYLQALRIRLHYLGKRSEDRLLFDFQNELAANLGFKTNAKKRASEQLMTRYYQGVRYISLMNEMLLKTFEAHLSSDTTPKPLNAHFSVERGLLITNSDDLFQTSPNTIFESFFVLQQNSNIKGFSASLITQLQNAKKSINRAFRQDSQNKALFLKILSEPEGVNRALRSMNRYGVLGQYIPAFNKIIGQMQHDLFHIYTVDEHTLNVLRNLRRFAKPELNHEFPTCSELFSAFDQPYLLYLGALFHDIAKGRGGDHSTLGTIDARRFCQQHDLPKADTELVAWLVESHLKLSSTAQKTDLSDPEVINAFADFVKTEYRLTALYLLTVADIRGTSPSVWNEWKAKLLENLYFKTLTVLQSEETDLDAQIDERKTEAKEKLESFDIKATSIDTLWDYLGEGYLVRFDSDEIAWQTRLLMPHQQSDKPIVRARLSPDGDGIQVMIYAKDRNEMFASICQFFNGIQYSIVQAKIYTTDDDYALDSFIVLEQETNQVSYSGLLSYIEEKLTAILVDKVDIEAPKQGRIQRQVKHMPINNKVVISKVKSSPFHQVDIAVNDSPGLLAKIAKQLLTLDIELHNAKINTMGNRVEDSFIISARQEQPLSQEKVALLTSALKQL